MPVRFHPPYDLPELWPHTAPSLSPFPLTLPFPRLPSFATLNNRPGLPLKTLEALRPDSRGWHAACATTHSEGRDDRRGLAPAPGPDRTNADQAPSPAARR